MKNVVHALDKKLFRDLTRLWAQALAIALVLACGVAIMLTGFGMYRSLDDTRSAYYQRNRFADVFAEVRRAPLSLVRDIEAIDGVWAAEARVTGSAILDIPDRIQTIVGHILSLPNDAEPRLNVPVLRSGRFPDPGARDEIVVNAPFAIANGLQPGDAITANLNGSRRSLTITGTVLSPEFIYTLGPGAMMPDNKAFGILWMNEHEAAAAYDMTGAFNMVSLKLSFDARKDEVIDRLDALLEPYGGLGAYDRSQQVSNAFIDAEIQQLRTMVYVMPPIFFGIAAFLVNMVIGRIISLERSEIGLLKAIGYTNGQICIHYLVLAGLIAVGGVGIGWVVGAWLAHGMAALYARFFDFPFLMYRASYVAYAISGLLGLVAALLGAARSALKAAMLPPAVAMAPPAPPHFSHNFLDRGLSALGMRQSGMMIFRSLTRWPVRSGLTVLGLALSVAILVSSGFFNDSLDGMMDKTFSQSNRQTATLTFTGDLTESVLEEVRRLPGVLQVEGMQAAPVTLSNGHLSKRTAIEARRPDPDLARVIDDAGRVLNAPPEGIILSDRLASQLDVTAGDTVDIRFMTGHRESTRVTVASTVPLFVGLGAYMDLSALNTLLRQGPQVSMAHVTLDPAMEDAFALAIKRLPKVASVTMLTRARRSFQDTIRENVIIMTTVYITIGVLITIGVTYNGARIQLSERARELASLRILGFTRAEVSVILVGETMLLAILAQPAGWLLGAGIAKIVAKESASDLYAIPFVLQPSTYATASLVVLGAALGAALVVRRRLDRLDLVAVLKTRE
jgi:putative ABC transport system permease protein